MALAPSTQDLFQLYNAMNITTASTASNTYTYTVPGIMYPANGFDFSAFQQVIGPDPRYQKSLAEHLVAEQAKIVDGIIAKSTPLMSEESPAKPFSDGERWLRTRIKEITEVGRLALAAA